MIEADLRDGLVRLAARLAARSAALAEARHPARDATAWRSARWLWPLFTQR